MVFVHCQGGISRSATIVIAYLMYKNNMTVNEASNYVKEHRPCICPNPNFMEQLEQYYKTLNMNINL